ncbi:MAG: hypothetical protein ABIS06_06150 [Vicinamibacterales bacterium]
MLEDLLPRWRGKVFVLVLLGFAATDFVITMTLSAADATEHIIHNPLVPAVLDHPVAVTLLLLAGLGGVFLKGFREIVKQAVALPVFPKLALGLSGFETDVAVMPLIERSPTDDSHGRALAYLAHEYLGEVFGTFYDISTIAILWFAGSSAMAGLLNLVPRYLPRFGMAPEWTRGPRPLVLLFTLIGFLLTVIFKANVEAQAGAYATWGDRRQFFAFAAVSLVFAYTTVTNVFERLDGVTIAAWFIGAIIASSLISRVMRSTELRVVRVEIDENALRCLQTGGHAPIKIIANRPDKGDIAEYEAKLREARDSLLCFSSVVIRPVRFRMPRLIAMRAHLDAIGLSWLPAFAPRSRDRP